MKRTEYNRPTLIAKKRRKIGGRDPPLGRIKAADPNHSAPNRSLEEAFVLNAVSRFDAYRNKKRSEALPRWAQSALYAAAAAAIFMFAFQFFFRYQYIQTNGVVWRIDRLTQQSCRMNGSVCFAPAKPKFSTSTSVSTSLSTSVSLKSVVPKKH